MKQPKFLFHKMAALAGLLVATTMAGAEPSQAGMTHKGTSFPGEKVDSGLGELPHYRHWKHTYPPANAASQQIVVRIPGEKLDSGLADVPVYRKPQTASVSTKLVAVTIATR